MKIGRNDPCHCGSGRKYKHCCYTKDSVKHEPTAAPEPPEEVDAAAETPADDEPDKQRQTFGHHKDRSRFQGEVRGGMANFKPRLTRGSQRGS